MAVAALILGGVSWVLSGSDSSDEQVKELTIYSGRSEEFIAPFFADWEQESGIKLNIRYGDSAELAAQILEEGKNSPADLFLSQDAGSLGAVSAAGLFTTLPAGVGAQIEDIYIAGNRTWIGVTGRARVFAYRPSAVSVLPQSVADLTKPIYKGRVGIAPSNASTASAKILDLSRPPVASSPLPSKRNSPKPKVLATSANALALTTAARSFAN